MKKTAYHLLAIITAIVVLAACQGEKSESTLLTATLSELTGTVELKQAEQADFSQAETNLVLNVNGQVRTGADGRARLDLSSGTIIRVAPSSLFTLTSNEEVEGGLFTKIALEAGKVFVILNGGQADVETPSGVASVKGSYLSVQVVDGQIVITCLEGNCSLAGNNGEEIVIPEGFMLTFVQDPNTGEWGAPVLGEMSPEEFEDWLNNNPEAKQLVEQGFAALTALASTEEPTEEPTEVPTEAATEPADSAGGTGGACSQIESPASGSGFGQNGQVNFAWTETSGASVYVITFINADGSRARIETRTNNTSFYIEVLPNGGVYEWTVTAYGSDGAEICTSTPATFTKPKADPTQKIPPTQDPNDIQEEPSASSCDPCDPNPSSGCYDYMYIMEFCPGL
ncbi:MAG: FecR domain-containing protein [Anaerolineales bacterium]|nr:FecR domain-containing protein [Anaerolineales bacterium]